MKFLTFTIIINTDQLQFGMLDIDLKIVPFSDFFFCFFYCIFLFPLLGKTDQGVNSL